NSPNNTAPMYPTQSSCPNSSQSLVSFSSGIAMPSITLVDEQNTTLGTTDGTISGTSAQFGVGPATAATFTVSNPGSPVAGAGFNETITAFDAYGNTATPSAGTRMLPGPQASPNTTPPQLATPSFTNGVASVAVTL